MQRGITLFNDLLPAKTLPEKQIKGRDKELISKRNELLLDRLFFYKALYRWDYDFVLEKLSNEFFLSERTIGDIISNTGSQLYLRTLKIEQPSKNNLEKKWPHLKWAA